MTLDYFEDLLKKPSIFKDESKLDINFVPNELPHRRKELSLLSQLFLALITHPNSISRKILITGKTGIGKTVTVKLFGEMLHDAAKKRNVSIQYVHINCRKERTSYKVLIKIVRALNKNFPKRGYSPQDLLEIIIDNLNNLDLHLLIILDELSYLINNNGDLIYSITRINDDSFNAQQRISIIGIVRDISCLNNLDISTLSTLQRNIIKFKEYNNIQIFDILKYRATISLKDDTFSDELIEMISELVSKNGDIRYGLNLLWRASKIAESKNLKYLTSECVRLGNQDLVPYSTQDVLTYMSSQRLFFLLAIIKALKKNEKQKISISEVLDTYYVICENLSIQKRSYSQLWNYLQDFKKEDIIAVKIKSNSIKGRKALIEIPNISLKKFEMIIVDIMQSKGIKI
ncbi:MAG: ORC1-type DNA replication protein [Candidatus Hodarchaeota archaeon]